MLESYRGYYSDCAHELMFFPVCDPFFANKTLTLLVSEVGRRLSQLNFLYDKVRSEEAEVGRLVPLRKMEIDIGQVSSANEEVLDHSTFKAEIFAEAFYVFAFRVIDIIRYLNKDIFKIQKIVLEPKGIVHIRNRLIIHPEDHNRLSWSLLVSNSDGRGVCLKNKIGRGENPDPIDPGFRANATELKEFFLKWASEFRVRLKILPPKIPNRPHDKLM